MSMGDHNNQTAYANLNLSVEPLPYLHRETEKVNLGVSRLTNVEDQLIWAYLLVIWVISVYANVVIVLFLARHKQRLRALDHLMKNIALSNGVLAFFTFPLMIISLMRHEWLFGIEGCIAYSFITTLCGLVSVWTLVGIAGLLYCRITASAYRIANYSWTKKDLLDTEQTRYVYYVIVFLIFDYSLCFVLCLLPLMGIGKYGLGKHGTSCTVDWSLPTLSSSIYLFFLFALGFAIPLVFIVAFYVGISRCLVAFSKKYVEGKNAKRWISVNKKTIKMAVYVAFSLIICWTPYAIVALWQFSGNPDTLPVRVEAAAALLAKSSTAVTPVVHMWFIKKYQLFFRQVFCCFHVSHASDIDINDGSSFTVESLRDQHLAIHSHEQKNSHGLWRSTEIAYNEHNKSSSVNRKFSINVVSSTHKTTQV